ncbi:hypothetical protein OL229_10690 [Neisseriaceae bacterium JH1-16]|nr:hypothetical protein [Neisseriaceae bacterium JH1-16]
MPTAKLTRSIATKRRTATARALLAATWLSVALLPSAVQAAPSIPSQPVHFQQGSSSATLKGQLKGPNSDGRDYVLRAKTGQTMTVELQTKSTSTYFNILPPNSDEALYVGEVHGDQHWSGVLPADGDYRVRVYLNRAASRKGKASSYALKIAVH